MMPSVMAQVSWSIALSLPLLAPMLAEATVCVLPMEQSDRVFLADDQPLLATDAGLATLTSDGKIDRFLFRSAEERIADLFKSAERVFFLADRQRPGRKWERQLYVMKNLDDDPKGLLVDDELNQYLSYYEVNGTVVVVLKSSVDSSLFLVSDDRLEPVELQLSPTITEHAGIIAEPIGTASKRKLLFIVNGNLLYWVTEAKIAYVGQWNDAVPISTAATRHGVFLAGLRGVYRLSQDGVLTDVSGVPAWSITGFYAAKSDIFAGTTNGLYKYIAPDQFVHISDKIIRGVHELAGHIFFVTNQEILELEGSDKLKPLIKATTEIIPWAGTEIWSGDRTTQVLVPTSADHIYRLTENGEVLTQRLPEGYAEGIVRKGRAKFTGTSLGVLLAAPDGLHLDDGEGGWLRVPAPELQLKEAPDVLAIPAMARHDGDEKAGAKAVAYANTSEGVLRLVDSPLAGVPVDFKEKPERWVWPQRPVALSWRLDNACAFVRGAATQILKVDAPEGRTARVPVLLDQESEYPFSALIEPEMTRASGDYAVTVEVQGAHGDVVGLGPVLQFSASRLAVLYRLWDAWRELPWWLRSTIIVLIGIVSFALIYPRRVCLYKYVRYQVWKLLGDRRSRERIFINYRRVDKAPATTLYLALQTYFESRLIFFDRADIEEASEWDTRLRHAVENCAVLIVMIGPNWANLTDPETGAPRLESPHDYVRQEIALALAGGKTIFPVLVDRATVPEERLLPDELRPLLRVQMFELSDRQDDYRTQVSRIAAKIGKNQDIRCPKGTWRLAGPPRPEAGVSVVTVPTSR